MKVDQNDEANSDTLTTYSPDASNYPNVEHSPSGHLSDRCPKPGKLSRMGSPSLGSVYRCVRSHPALRIAMSYFVLQLSTLYLLFLPPPSLSIDVDTAADVAEYGYVADDQVPFAEQPGKQTPLTHAFGTQFFLPPACIRNCCYIVLSYF